MKDKYVIIVSDDQVDYDIDFDSYNLRYNEENDLPMILRYIENDNYIFDNREDADRVAQKLNELLGGDSYFRRSEKVDIILEMLEGGL